jgi:hypothetical protein
MSSTDQSTKPTASPQTPTKTEPGSAPSTTTPDAVNIKAADVLTTQGKAAFVKHVFTDQDTGRELSYSEMRQLYG